MVCRWCGQGRRPQTSGCVGVKAMILAAGLGQRMRPLTDTLPKPLLPAAGKPLLQYHLEALRQSGVREVIINLAYLGEKIRSFVGDGRDFGLEVVYSEEPEPLETGGALLRALPLLGADPFLLINGDVWTDYPLSALSRRSFTHEQLGHLVLVPNPDFHPTGDFALSDSGLLVNDNRCPRYTFAGISLLHPQLIRDYPQQRPKFPLGEVLRLALANGQLRGEVYTGRWSDVGTPARLQALTDMLSDGQVSMLKS